VAVRRCDNRGVRILVLQHIACEPPGAYEDVLLERGASLARVELDEGEPLPDWRGFDGIVAMGGPMSVNDEAEHPWLHDEKRLIREAVEAGLPFFGACLGVQLLAASLGARVYAGGEPEVGVLEVALSDEGAADPLFAGLPRSFLTLQWHGDTFELPAGAVRLLGSDAYPNQGFRVGRTAYGVQFHLEVSRAMAAEWGEVPAYAAALEQVRGPGALRELLNAHDRVADGMLEHARTIFERWVALVEQAAPAPAG
jgi:GMP synthase-like glutamine amidotransferase